MERTWFFLVLIFSLGLVVAEDVSSGGTFYTSDFYLFLGLVCFVLLIVALFFWLWIRGPKNKWEK